jgi:sugar phosphate isomerase/epimerase
VETNPILGMYAGFGFHVSFEERVRLIAEAGFDCTSLWWEHKNERVRELKHFAPGVARLAGLAIESIHVPYSNCNDFWSGGKDVRTAALTQHCEWLDDCNRHEIPHMVMHVTLGKTPPSVNAKGLSAYEDLVRYAEGQGVIVAIENTRSDEHLDFLFERIDSKFLGLCYDVSHDVLYADSPGKLLSDHSERLVSTHLADTDGVLDRHWLPGTGSIDYNTVLEHFPSSYTGALVLEVSSGKKFNSLVDYVSDAYSSLCGQIVSVLE